MVGFLQDPDDSNKLQQLYGRRTYPNSDHWNYFVKSDQYHQIPIPVSLHGQNCTDERGCKELNDQDTIKGLMTELNTILRLPGLNLFSDKEQIEGEPGVVTIVDTTINEIDGSEKQEIEKIIVPPLITVNEK